MHYVELTKLRPAENARLEAAAWANYQLGTINENVSLPNGYTLTGYLHELPKVGHYMQLKRDARNGVKVEGIYMSTRVSAIFGREVHTQNSVYLIRQLDADNSCLLA